MINRLLGQARPAVLRPAVGTAVLVLAVASCGGDGNSDAASSAPGSATGTTDPTASTVEAADQAAVEQAYLDFVRVTWTFDKHAPPSQWRQVVGTVAVEPLLTTVVAAATSQRQQGIVLYGQPVSHVRVEPINGADTATVHDCQDASRAGQADATTNERLSRGKAHTPVVATLVRQGDGGWKVSDTTFPGGEC